MEFHPLANVFPLLPPDELAALADDIAAHGLREPITTYEGRVLDGRNRYNACLKAGREPRFAPWEGRGGDPVAFVVSMNLRRRHLDESQRALVAAKLADLKRGQRADLRGVSIEKTLENRAILNSPIGGFNSPDRPPLTAPQAAELLNVGERSVSRARRVLAGGNPELLAAVEQGRLKVSDAAKVAGKPASVQSAAVEAVAAGKARTAAEAARAIERGGLAPDTSPALTDRMGLSVPDAYRAIFAARAQFDEAARRLDLLRKDVEELAESPAGYYLRKELRHLSTKFKEIRHVITYTAPYTVAPGKRGEPKWVSEIGWRTLGDDERQISPTAKPDAR